MRDTKDTATLTRPRQVLRCFDSSPVYGDRYRIVLRAKDGTTCGIASGEQGNTPNGCFYTLESRESPLHPWPGERRIQWRTLPEAVRRSVLAAIRFGEQEGWH